MTHPPTADPGPRTDGPLIELGAALRDLHKSLLDEQRVDYELAHGPVGGGQWLHLVAYDQSFAWLRTLSALIVDLDALLEEPEAPSAEETGALRAELDELFSPAAPARFWDNCLPRLQTPRVAVAYGRVRTALSKLTATPKPAAPDAASELHAQHRWAVARRMRGQG